MPETRTITFMADLDFSRWNCITRQMDFTGTTVYSFADLISERDDMAAQGWEMTRQERII